MARMFTMDDLKGRGGGSGDDGDDMYAGGKSSGIAVSGGRRGRGIGGDKVDNIFDSASKTERKEMPGDEGAGSRSDHTIAFYKNGFVVNDGPLRGYDDDENKEFLSEVDKGYVPAELRDTAGGKPVGIAVSDKRTEDYRPPTPPPYTAFSGGGATAGSGAEAAAAVQASEIGRSTGAFAVDESVPTTTIRVSLIGGGKLTLKFNRTHTVADLQGQVAEKSGASSFVLIGGFPPKPLADSSATLESAGLINAAVRMKSA